MVFNIVLQEKMKYTQAEQRTIEKAISYLVENFNATGHNEKPVIWHSLRVAFYLTDQKYSAEVIVAAILHDLLEDTAVTFEQIVAEFGATVAEIVAAVSFDAKITDYEQQYQDTFRRCLAVGEKALVVKAADILDNSDYYPQAKDGLKSNLINKLSTFIKIATPLIGQSQVLKDLKQREKTLNSLL